MAVGQTRAHRRWHRSTTGLFTPHPALSASCDWPEEHFRVVFHAHETVLMMRVEQLPQCRKHTSVIRVRRQSARRDGPGPVGRRSAS